ncbi:PREDICTED: serpin B4-like [Phaethon lepturus]|uniref:serpin B4-like n=1 Tax=Phaethon lepturus TaxID=97097 RepID=UPI00053097E6|nr:PREDICTED: serpin B4-like [Phaethon lepturus]
MGFLSAANVKFCLSFFKELNKHEAKQGEEVLPAKWQHFIQKHELEAVDFINAAEESREKINSSVEKQTGGKIKDLFPPGSVDCTTALALVNAMHFKGEYRNVLMMCQAGKYKLARRQEEQVTELELLYTGEELSTFILLPESICAYLRRFRMEETCELIPVLQTLGKRDSLSKALHKSFVEVNEEGTEAAAATRVTIIPLCLHIPYEFRDDHPFLFLIKHNLSQNILLFG